MRQALELAVQGLGRTSPNPAVGAVIVRDGEVVGEGWHRAAGQPHAEIEALRQAGERARGATLYVTLEPCSHHGRTPPCTTAILEAGIARVFYACPDCDPRCAGRAEDLLARAGVEVACGPLTEEGQELNQAYFKHKQTGRPYVTLKLALTLDGRMATRTGDSRWITSEEARRRVHALRDQSDAVLVGAGTVAQDDPQLTARLENPRDGHQPRPVVLAADGISPQARLLRGPARPILFVAPGNIGFQACHGRTGVPPVPEGHAVVSPTHESPLSCQERGLGGEAPEIVPVPGADGLLDLPAVLTELGRRSIMSVLVEGGAALAGSFLHAGLVDKLLLFYAPRLLLDREAPGPYAPDLCVPRMAEALNLRLAGAELVGPDLMLTLYPSPVSGEGQGWGP